MLLWSKRYMNLTNRIISIWGDSILKGIVLDDESGRYKVLEQNCVRGFEEQTGTSVRNKSGFGMTIGRALGKIKKSLALTPPVPGEIVLIEYGGNDCDFFWDKVAEHPETEHLPHTPLKRFGELLQQLLDTFKAKSVLPVLMTLPPIDAEKYFAWISRGLDAEKILAWLGDVQSIYRWHEAYSNVILETACRNNLRLIDVRKDFLVNRTCSSLHCSDGIHLNEAGQKLMLDSVLSYVKSA